MEPHYVIRTVASDIAVLLYIESDQQFIVIEGRTHIIWFEFPVSESHVLVFLPQQIGLAICKQVKLYAILKLLTQRVQEAG